MRTPYKVIYFCDAVFLGGAEAYLKLLVPEIPHDQYQPRVALSPLPEMAPLARFFKDRGILVDELDSANRSPLRVFLESYRYFRRQQPTIVHFNLNNTFSCFVPILAAYFSRVPWRLATEHLDLQLAIGKRAGVRTKKFVKRVMTFCLDYTIPVSQANKQLLVEDYRVNPYRLKLILNGVDVNRFAFSASGRRAIRQSLGIGPEQTLIGTVARFNFQKGHQYTVEAIPSILKSCPQARFLFVGEGPTQARLADRVRQLGLQPYVTFAGAREDIPEILSALDIFLLTSLYEGLPLSILEAMAVGLPVVATSVSGTPEAVTEQHTGLLIPPEDSQAVASAVVRLVKDPESRRRMGANGRKLVHRRFDKSLMVGQVEHIYQNLVDRQRRPAAHSKTPDSGRRRASLIVLTWNKREILKEALDALVEAVRHDGGDHEIILVDNGSTDGTQDYVRTHYRNIRLIELKKNYRFSRANNIGVQCARNEVVVLLNNDVIVQPGFLDPLLKGFERPDVFAVTSQIFNYDSGKTRLETGKTFGMMMFGCMHVGHTPPTPVDEKRQYVPAFYAHGGSSAYHRQKFLELGGFSEIYNPAYVEDADLSYRAWKAGFRVLFCPASRVAHKHRSTNATEIGNSRIDYLIARNLFVLFWKNVTSFGLFFSHLLKLPFRFLLDISRGRLGILKAFAGALLKAPQVVWNRLVSPPPGRLSDQEAIAAIHHWFFYRHRYLSNGDRPAGPRKILVVSKRLPRLGVDGSWILVNLLKGLSARNEITLLSFIETSQDQAHVDRLKQYCKEVRTITLYPYDRELKSAFLFSKLLAVVHACLMMRREVLNELSTGDYDLVQCEYLHTLNFIPDLRRYPSLLTHHEVLSLAYERLFRKAGSWGEKISAFIKWRLMRVYEKRLCRKVRSVVALSAVDRDYLSRRLKVARPCLAQSGVDVDFFRSMPGVRERPNSLMFVGFFKHPPNVQGMSYFFREIWPGILEAVPNATLTVVGRSVPSHLSAHSKKGQVAFLDGVEDLRPLLSSHAVFVAPIVSGAGLRGKLLEAMAMGKAVVATRLCLDGYPFHHDRDLMVADSSAEFLHYTLELLKDPLKRRRLGGNARAKVEDEYSSPRFAADYEQLYEELSA
jgi:glycosyltransferase involved in cell wall biosynthesis/GT2 family glycosyltransferase